MTSKRASRSKKTPLQTMDIDVSTVIEVCHDHEAGHEHFELQPASGFFTPSSGSDDAKLDDAKLDEKELNRLNEMGRKGASELYFVDLEGEAR